MPRSGQEELASGPGDSLCHNLVGLHWSAEGDSMRHGSAASASDDGCEPPNSPCCAALASDEQDALEALAVGDGCQPEP